MTAARAIDLGSEAQAAQAAGDAGRPHAPLAGSGRRGPTEGDPTLHQPLAAWLPAGGLVELSGGAGAARVSLAVSLVTHAQRASEPAAWIEDATTGGLYPPDLAAVGVDLERLVVIRVPRERSDGAGRGGRARRPRQRGTHRIARAAELLLRSGGFGLVVLDLVGLGARDGHGTDVWLGRLAGLARRHGTRIALLTGSDAAASSLGPLIATRIGAQRTRIGPGFHALTPVLWKDKGGRAGVVGDPATEWRRPPWGVEGVGAAAGGTDSLPAQAGSRRDRRVA